MCEIRGRDDRDGTERFELAHEFGVGRSGVEGGVDATRAPRAEQRGDGRGVVGQHGGDHLAGRQPGVTEQSAELFCAGRQLITRHIVAKRVHRDVGQIAEQLRKAHESGSRGSQFGVRLSAKASGPSF